MTVDERVVLHRVVRVETMKIFSPSMRKGSGLTNRAEDGGLRVEGWTSMGFEGQGVDLNGIYLKVEGWTSMGFTESFLPLLVFFNTADSTSLGVSPAPRFGPRFKP